MFGWNLDSERVFGQAEGMPRTRVRRRRLVLTGLIVVLTACLLGPVGHAFVAGAEVRKTSQHTYVVRPGDTLWSIAGREVAPGVDPRPMIDAIERANGGVAAGMLVAGRPHVIPASA